jgi:hypothetical protein
MLIGEEQGLKVLPNDTTSYVILIEPPDAAPHVRWCERERLASAPYSIFRSSFHPLEARMSRTQKTYPYPHSKLFPELNPSMQFLSVAEVAIILKTSTRLVLEWVVDQEAVEEQ